MIGKPVITSFTICADVRDQPPVELPAEYGEDPRPELIVSQLKVVLEQLGPERAWGAREVWASGQVSGAVFTDLVCWQAIGTPEPVEDSPSLPDWIRDFVKERVQRAAS